MYRLKQDYSSNLVAKYNFDEGSGVILTDSTGNYNGTINGATWVTEENALSFDGIDDYIDFIDPVIPVNKKSIKLTIKTPSTTPTNWMIILDNSNVDWSNTGIVLAITPDGFLRFVGSKGTANEWNFECVSSTNICDGNVHNILLTWDGTLNSNSIIMYIDNMIISNSTTTPISNISSYDNNLRIGFCTLGTTQNDYFEGSISNLEIYNEVIEFVEDLYFIKNSDNNIYTLQNNTLIEVPNTTQTSFENYGITDLNILTTPITNLTIPMKETATANIFKTTINLNKFNSINNIKNNI